MSIQSKKQTKIKAETISNQPYRLILNNDDYNSFEWVIKCLMKICNHEQNQAEQCAFIVHTRGKCDVKYGDEETISNMKNKLRSAGLSATMEKN
ncbi:MAG: ATP-dependent Clp protease adaptor ClpS [Candidatus Muirbacterium halophilum]|nr:ATP-dependent Clp protease adaptor ClpS [Candidatus Muirbacterium halophilum]